MRKIVILKLLMINVLLSLQALDFDTPEIISRAAVLIDAQTGAVLFSKNPNEEIPPASLTKLMTMHLLLKEIESGRASFDELIPITEESWARNQPWRSSLMFLEPGQSVTLREILLGLAVVSGNDAATAAALRLAPTVQEFAAKMTAEAYNMGLFSTRFTEASGISHNNMTTAADFASFCRQYIAMHPYSLKEFHSVTSFAYPLAANVQDRYKSNPHTIVQENRNSLLTRFDGVDGLKTGFINQSGYNIALTAEKNNTRFIAVILGAPNTPGGSRIRDEDGQRLLTWAFNNFKTVRPLIDKAVIEQIAKINLYKGKNKFAELELGESPYFTAHISRADSLRYEIDVPNPLTAPLAAGSFAGYLYINDEHGELTRVPLVTKNAYERGNFLKRIWHSILLLFIK